MKLKDKFKERDGYFWILLITIFALMMIGHFNQVVGQTPDDVYRMCVREGIEHPEIVTKQSILETGWYKCDKCSMRYNNIFGFRLSKNATEENPLGYLKFDHWRDSVLYYVKWQKKWYKGGDYYTFLKSIGYATSKTYLSKLKTINYDFH